MPIRRTYGALADTFDPNDFSYAKVVAPSKRPDHVDNAPFGSVPIYDQGQLGTCMWWTVRENIEALQPEFHPSVLWGYYKTRVKMRTTHEDSGSSSRATLSVLLHMGCAPEADWAYSDDQVKFTKAPPHKANLDAKKEVIGGYRRLRTLDEILDCLASGRNVMLGFALCDEFESDDVANTGLVPMPKTGNIVGLHEMTGDGYKIDASAPGGGILKVRNHWGDWGKQGWCFFPFAYWREPKLALDAYVLDDCHARAA
jgi:hypothetical protein